MQTNRYYLGLDIGTDSIGYAVTDEKYNLLKKKGEPLWGVHIFDAAATGEERRAFRTNRRRLDRRQARVRLVQELFANEISQIDPNFFLRIKESALYKEDSKAGVCLFKDKTFTDKDYYKKYPTIHHLIVELMESDEVHDVRLVYLACAWLVAHRGHFLKEISLDNIDSLDDIDSVYKQLLDYFVEEKPWYLEDSSAFGEILKQKLNKSTKYRELCKLLYNSNKAPDGEEFPYSREVMLKLLCGSKCKVADLYKNAAYSQIESVSLDMEEARLADVYAELGDDAELLQLLKGLFDWTVLCDVRRGERFVSKAKVRDYEIHRSDLALLKFIVRKYSKDKYNEVFRKSKKGLANYSAYSGNFKCGTVDESKRCSREDFYKYVKKLLDSMKPKKEDSELFEDIKRRMEYGAFMPKQVNGDNRVIPYQVYYAELRQLLEKASAYLPFLTVRDEDGWTTKDKLLSVFSFRVPYYIGPLNPVGSDNAWLKRKADGRIYPWNFEEMIDLDESEQRFIKRMTNSCAYLPGEDVLPKQSLLYEKFCVLNEINVIRINDRRLPTELKQRIYNELFMEKRRVTVKDIREFILSNGYCTKKELDSLAGLDKSVKSSLGSYHAFKPLMLSDKLSEQEVERIIEHGAYSEDKLRFNRWLEREFTALSEEDRKYVCRLKYKDFGRLSAALLNDMLIADRNGEANTVIEWMWQQSINLMELQSDRYDFVARVDEYRREYYCQNEQTLNARLDSMYISNAVKRPIIRALDIVKDVVKAQHCPPDKIFIEMARGASEEQKGKRTSSRYETLCKLYEKCDTEDVRIMQAELEAMGEQRENRLQSERVYLYFTQLGKCMYSGKPISLEKLSSDQYDIDHIYPQSKVKDDSLHNNKVLVDSKLNKLKDNKYPVPAEFRANMSAYWRKLKDAGLITEEKFRRLTRAKPFDEDEEWGFINRQLVETRQSTKAVATLLKEKYPSAEIVYVKAGMVSEFRQEFDMLKCRSVNDLHHAKDAYLNVVVGNVYNERFTRHWYLANRENYSVNIKAVFSHPVTVNGRQVWAGESSIAAAARIVREKNAVHLTRYAQTKTGGYFDQMPIKAAEGLIPRKSGLNTEKYGGYNKSAAAYFVLARFTVKNKNELMIVPVDMLVSKRFMEDEGFALDYLKTQIKNISGNTADNVALPLGLRPVKINTVIELDGLRMTLSGKSNGGKTVLLSTNTPLILGYHWEKYIKHIERFCEKKAANPKLIYSEKHDGINAEENLELYSLLLAKLCKAPYINRPANPIEAITKGKKRFTSLSIYEQVHTILQIIALFNRKAGGCDLERIGGVKKAGVTTLSSNLSNWKKSYTAAYIVDSSATGIWESRTANLLELI